jgi:hypothetical protein
MNNDIKKTIRLSRSEWQKVSKNLDDTNLNFSRYARDCLANKKIFIKKIKYFYIYIQDWWNFILGFSIPTIFIIIWFSFSDFNYILKCDTITIKNKIYIVISKDDFGGTDRLENNYLIDTHKKSFFKR